MTTKEKTIYSFIPLVDFKSVLGVDDRDDKLAVFCLVAATHTIEQFCWRRLLRKKHSERIEFSGDLLLTLREYPVTDLLAVYALSREAGVDGELLGKEFYGLFPEKNSFEDWPYTVSLSHDTERYYRMEAVKIVYSAGYTASRLLPDLAAACMELAT